MLQEPSPAQSKRSSPTTRHPIFVVDSDTVSVHSKPEESTWDDEHGITTLRKHYALRDEAETAVVESKRTVGYSVFSLFKVGVFFSFLHSFCLIASSAFQAPGSPAGMQARSPAGVNFIYFASSVVETQTYGDCIEPICAKGTSRRISGELYNLKVIDSWDVILHILDARDPLGTICDSVLDYIKKEKSHKQVISSIQGIIRLDIFNI